MVLAHGDVGIQQRQQGIQRHPHFTVPVDHHREAAPEQYQILVPYPLDLGVLLGKVRIQELFPLGALRLKKLFLGSGIAVVRSLGNVRGNVGIVQMQSHHKVTGIGIHKGIPAIVFRLLIRGTVGKDTIHDPRDHIDTVVADGIHLGKELPVPVFQNRHTVGNTAKKHLHLAKLPVFLCGIDRRDGTEQQHSNQ